MDEKYPTGPIQNLMKQMSDLEKFRNENQQLFETLTDRETDVLRFIALGKKNQVIANELNIARVTVQNHRQQLRSKLNIKNQTDFVKFAMAFDLIKL